MGNGHEYMGSKAVNERVVDFRLKLVDVDGLAMDLGIGRKEFLRRREDVFADIERITPGIACDRARIRADGLMTAGFSQAMEFIRRVYADRSLFAVDAEHASEAPSPLSRADPAISRTEQACVSEAQVKVHISTPVSESPRSVGVVDTPVEPRQAAPTREASDFHNVHDHDDDDNHDDRELITITLVDAERMHFFSMRSLFEGAASYSAVKDKAGKAKRECAKLAAAIASELGVNRDEIWVGSRRHPNQARIDVVNRFMEHFYGGGYAELVQIDASLIQPFVPQV